MVATYRRLVLYIPVLISLQNPTFTFCPPMESSYSSSSDGSMYSGLNDSDMYSSGGINIPRSQSSFDSFGDFSPPNSYTLQDVPDAYALNAPYTVPVQASSPFDPAPLQWPPLNWEDIPLPEYLGTSGSSPEQPKWVSVCLPGRLHLPTNTAQAASTTIRLHQLRKGVYQSGGPQAP